MPSREDETWSNSHPPYCTCAACTKKRLSNNNDRTWQYGAVWEHPKVHRTGNLQAWMLILIGILFLTSGIFFYSKFVTFFQLTGIRNNAFMQSIKLPLEVFGGALVFSGLIRRGRLKVVIASGVIFGLFVSYLFAWHTPSLKAKVFENSGNSQYSLLTPTPTATVSATLPSPSANPTQRPTSTPQMTATPTTPILTRTPAPSPVPTPQTPTPIPPVLDKSVTIDGQQYQVKFWKLDPKGRVEATVTLPTGIETGYGASWSGFTLEQILSDAKARGDKVAWAVALAAQGTVMSNTRTPVRTPTIVPRTFPAPSPSPKVTATVIPAPPIAPRLQDLYQYMLDLINKDRRANGLGPVVLGTNSAAQKHAEDRLTKDYSSHWGTDGMKPYIRYTLAGGFNYDAENGFVTRTVWYGVKDPSYKRDPKEMLDEAEKSLMGSPGHRRNILDRWHKRVNLGIAFSNESLHLAQDFEGDYVTFTTLPNLSGNMLSMAGKLSQGSLYNVALYYDPLPQPLTPKQLEAPPYDYAYGMGEKVGLIIPPALPGSYYSSLPPTSIIASAWSAGSDGQFSITANISLALQRGKGIYTAMIWADINGESKDVTNYSIFVR
ncbi:MAG: hypothetical protein HY671_14820 [Chloroflexi bacterium]|nr:hypothetical protein [Chloroflexota bacterium]